MKKLCIALLLLLLLFGCSSKEAEVTPTPEPTLTGNIFLDAEREYHSSEGGGMTCTISVNKEDAQNASAEDYKAFIDDRLDKAADHYELFGVVFEDGTGITYYGCDPANAVYGTITYKGVSREAYGSIIPDDDGGYAYSPYDD